ncbi:MAG: hypothetical protein R6W75_01385 [Smithellaceae bacterium]
MNIIYCCCAQDQSCDRVTRVVDILVAADKFDTFHHLQDFEKYLRTSLASEHLVILHAGSKKHLEQFLSLQELFIGQKTIVIVPDRQPDTIALGHSLRPRFITYADSDFLEMASVIRNILHHPESGKAGQGLRS